MSEAAAERQNVDVVSESTDNLRTTVSPGSLIVDLSHMRAESVCILGCRVIRIFKESSPEGASRILIALLAANCHRKTVAQQFGLTRNERRPDHDWRNDNS